MRRASGCVGRVALIKMDIEILAWISRHRNPFLDAFMSLVTNLGGELVIIFLACAVYWLMNRRFGDRMLLTMFSGILVNQALKIAFVVQRPWLRSERVIPLEGAIKDATGYSFPSGHTANAVSLFGCLSREKRLKRFSPVFWIIAFLIGLSRMYLGVHTPQDVLVSFIIGVFLVFGMEKLTDMLYEKPAIDKYIAGASVLFGAALCVFALLRPYPDDNGAKNALDAIKLSGASIGLMTGWLIERRKIKFDKPKTLLAACIRLLGGLAIVLIILKGMKAPLISFFGETAGSFIRYALVGFSASCLWPLAFKKLNM